MDDYESQQMSPPRQMRAQGSGDMKSIGDFARGVAGGGLVVVGAVLSIWMLAMIYGILNGEEEMPIVARLVPQEAITFGDMKYEGEPIVLPPGVGKFFVYILIASFVGIMARIATAFITSGIGLLKPDDLATRMGKSATEFRMLFGSMTKLVKEVREDLDDSPPRN